MHKLTSTPLRVRDGWLLVVGVILAAPIVQNNKHPMVGIVAATTAVLSIATFIRLDLPRLPATDLSSS